MEMITDFFPGGIPHAPIIVKKGKTKKEKIPNMSKDQFKATKREHKREIRKYRAERKALIKQWFAKGKDIKAHKLLIKQARIVKKLNKNGVK